MKEDFLTALKEVDNFTYTENGAYAYRSTGNKVLDAFGSLGAMMNSDVDEILTTFYNAFYADRSLAMRLLFYVRDIRGGQGMRNVFRIILRSLASKYPELVTANLENILFFGRGDDLFCLFNTPCEKSMMEFCRKVLYDDFMSLRDGGSCSLLAKWMPSENATSDTSKILARKFIKYFETTPKQYRQMLSALRREIGIVESKMSSNDWGSINFEKLPSRASMIYSDAFIRHVKESYTDYLKSVANGDAKINAGALFPVDIIHNVLDKYYKYGWGGKTPSLKDTYLYDAMWNALPNYFGDTEETGLCVVDTSGSMHGKPMEVAISLGMYCADKANGPFKNHFITFSSNPKLQEIVGDNIFDKVNGIVRTDWEMNTNIEAVFELILHTALENNLAQDDLPSKLYIISDMQFDEATDDRFSNYGKSTKQKTFMDSMKSKYTDAGYSMPAIVYWNVRASDCGMFQNKFDGEDCCMVSGYSASLFKSVIDGTEYITETNENGETIVKQKIEPLEVMLNTLNNERYDRVVS